MFNSKRGSRFSKIKLEILRTPPGKFIPHWNEYLDCLDFQMKIESFLYRTVPDIFVAEYLAMT